MTDTNWTRLKLEKLKKARASAVARGSESFLFEGQEVLCSYAKYLIEYLESVLEPDRGQMNGFGAGRVEQMDTARLLREYGFEDQGGDYWTRLWSSSWVEVIPQRSLRWFLVNDDGGELADQVIGDVAPEDLERIMEEADYFDEHGRRMPHGRTLNGYELPQERAHLGGFGAVPGKCSEDSIPEVKLALAKNRCLTAPRVILKSAFSVAAFLTKHYGCQPQEQFLVVGLDAKAAVLGVLTAALGGLDSTMVDPRVVFSGLILMGASAFILAHNHPSGDPEPSVQDYELTRQLRTSSEMLGIRLLDHIIIGRTGQTYSMSERGTLPR